MLKPQIFDARRRETFLDTPVHVENAYVESLSEEVAVGDEFRRGIGTCMRFAWGGALEITKIELAQRARERREAARKRRVKGILKSLSRNWNEIIEDTKTSTTKPLEEGSLLRKRKRLLEGGAAERVLYFWGMAREWG